MAERKRIFTDVKKDLVSLNEKYPKLLIDASGNYTVINGPGQLPESLGENDEIMEPKTKSPRGDFVFSAKTKKGTKAFIDSRFGFRTTNGSDYQVRGKYGLQNPITDFENLHTYLLDTPNYRWGYYDVVAEVDNLDVVAMSFPSAFDKKTKKKLWEASQEFSDYYLFWLNEKKKIFATYWPSYASSENKVAIIDATTGESKVFELPIEYNETYLKANGDLLLFKQHVDHEQPADVYVFSERENGYRLREVLDENTRRYFDRSSFYANMHPINNYHTSPDGKKYYAFASGAPFACFDMETDELLWEIEPSVTYWSPVEHALQNPITGDFLITEADIGSNVIIRKVSWETGEILQEVSFLDDDGGWAPQYYYQAHISPYGTHFLFSNNWTYTIIFDYETMEIIKTDVGFGEYYLPSTTSADGIEIVGYDNTFNASPGINYINWNTLEIKLHPRDWKQMNFSNEEYSTPTFNESGIMFQTYAGGLMLATNKEIPELTKVSDLTPSESVGADLPEGWYYDSVGSTLWRPPAMVSSIPSHGQKLALTYATYEGVERCFAIENINDNYPVAFRISIFEGGKFVEWSIDELDNPSITFFNIDNYSRNSGWLYSTQRWAYNFITKEIKDLITPININRFYPASMYDGIEYFSVTTAATSTTAIRYNHNTNTRSSMSKVSGGIWSRSRPLKYGNYLYQVGHDGGSPRRTRMWRYNISINMWTALSYSPELAMINPTAIYDTARLYGDYVYIVNSGYKYHIPTDTWEEVSQPYNIRGSSASTFVDSDILYTIPGGLFSNSLDKRPIVYHTAAYAFPGAKIPY